MTTKLGIAMNRLSEIAATVIENVFPDECSISRPAQSSTVTAYGGVAPSYSTVASSIGCAWAPSGKTGMEYMRAGQINEAVPYTVTLPGSIDVKPKDRIVVVARGDEPARTFEVKALLRNAGVTIDALCTLEEQ